MGRSLQADAPAGSAEAQLSARCLRMFQARHKKTFAAHCFSSPFQIENARHLLCSRRALIVCAAWLSAGSLSRFRQVGLTEWPRTPPVAFRYFGKALAVVAHRLARDRRKSRALAARHRDDDGGPSDDFDGAHVAPGSGTSNVSNFILASLGLLFLRAEFPTCKVIFGPSV